MMEMFNPMHPGEMIKKLYIKESGISLRAVADALGGSAESWLQKTIAFIKSFHSNSF